MQFKLCTFNLICIQRNITAFYDTLLCNHHKTSLSLLQLIVAVFTYWTLDFKTSAFAMYSVCVSFLLIVFHSSNVCVSFFHLVVGSLTQPSLDNGFKKDARPAVAAYKCLDRMSTPPCLVTVGICREQVRAHSGDARAYVYTSSQC